MSLDKLFQQILQSEQTAETRRENIVKIKKQIAQSEAEVASLKESVTSSRGRLNIIVRQFHDEKAECLVLHEQRKVLQEKIGEVDEDVEKLKASICEREKVLNDMKSRRFESIMNFCQEYDLTGKGAEKRRIERQQNLADLHKMKKELERKIEIAQAEEEKNTELLEQKKCLKVEISGLQSTIIEVDSEIGQKGSEMTDAQKQVEQFKAECHSDPELSQLQTELDSLKNQDLEARVRCLRAELGRVKNRMWQKRNQLGTGNS